MSKYLFHKKLVIIVTSLLLVTSPVIATENTSNDKQTAHDELRLLLQKAIKDSDSFSDRYDAEVWLLDMSKND